MALTWTSYDVSPPQSVENVPPTINRLLFHIGGNLYYVTSAQVGVAEATENIWIMKSTDMGATWNRVYNGPKTTFDFAAVAIGSNIYIFGDDSNTFAMHVYVYNTVANSLVEGSLPGINFLDVVAAPYSDGTVLVAYMDLSTSEIRCVIYDTGTGSWGTPQLALAASPRKFPIGLVNDPSQDVAFLFTTDSPVDTLYCTPISNPTTVGTTVIAVATSGISEDYNTTYGTPVVSNGQVAIPYVDPVGTTDPLILNVVRSTASVTLSFGAPEVIETGTAFPGPGPWTLDSTTLWFGWALVDFNGTLYAIWSHDTNQNDNSASQTTVKVSAYSGGWSAPEIAWTGPTPSASMSLYPLGLSSTQLGIIAAYADPVLFFGSGTKYESLKVVFILGTQAVSGGSATYCYQMQVGVTPF